jgi:hypothetical protein
MRYRLLNLIWCTALAAALAGCGGSSHPKVGVPKAALPKIEVPDKLTLYSIDGRYYPRLKKDYSGEVFDHCPVLGKTDIASIDARKQLIAALNDGIAQSDGTMAGCFNPRHAIRAVVNGRTIDYLICFECLQVMIDAGGSRKIVPITRDAQEVFNRYLKDAGIALAPAATE